MSKTLPLWVEPWSVAKQPHHWTSNWALPVCLLADILKLKFMMPGVETARPSRLAFSESSRTLEMLARAPEHQQWRHELWFRWSLLCHSRRARSLPCCCRFLYLQFLILLKCRFQTLEGPPLMSNSIIVACQCGNSIIQNFSFYSQFLHEKCLSGPTREITHLLHDKGLHAP